MAKTKKCYLCKKNKSKASFNKDASRTDGISVECRECSRKRKSNYGKTIDGYLSKTYKDMRHRVEGRQRPRMRHYWEGKQILARDVFLFWARNHPGFLRIHKRWAMSDYDKKLSPSINRMDSAKGYTLDNLEWITHSQNSSLAGTVRSFNKRQGVYKLLGELNVQK